MMADNLLIFNLSPEIHPYPEDPNADFEIWSLISLYLISDPEKKLLLETQWDIIPFTEWFITNCSALCHESLTMISNEELRPLPSESLAQALRRLLDRDFSSEDQELQWHTTLFEFRQRHALRFALRGARIPDIIIGYNHQAGEVSCDEEGNQWSYTFNMKAFCNNLKQELILFFKAWLEEANNRSLQRKVLALLQALDVAAASTQIN